MNHETERVSDRARSRVAFASTEVQVVEVQIIGDDSTLPTRKISYPLRRQALARAAATTDRRAPAALSQGTLAKHNRSTPPRTANSSAPPAGRRSSRPPPPGRDPAVLRGIANKASRAESTKMLVAHSRAKVHWSDYSGCRATPLHGCLRELVIEERIQELLTKLRKLRASAIK